MVAIVEMQPSGAEGRQGSLPHRDCLIDALAELGQVPKAAVMSELSIKPVALLLKRRLLPEMSRKRSEEWFLHEKRRWESRHTLGTPDLDNILKPLIDGLCGPSGLLIDDCQVQSVACNWIDWERDPEQLCWPIPSSLEAAVQLIFVQKFRASLSLRDQFLAAGIPEADAKFHMPIQRRFHRARLQKHGFDVRPVADYKASLEGQQ